MKTKVGCIVLALLASGCTTFGASRMFQGEGDDWVMLAGSGEGIRQYHNGLNGLVTNSRGNPDIKSAFWQNQDQETQVKTLRFRRVAK